MKRIQIIFRTCYELIEKYSGGITDSDWKDINNYHEGKLDDKDPLAVALFTACVEELMRQYKSLKDSK